MVFSNTRSERHGEAVSDSNLPPEQWRSLFDTIGVEFGYRPLANHIGMDHTRLRRLLLGGGTSEDALQQVADAFRVPAAKVRELRGEAAVDRKPFTLPDDAGRLTERERDVIRSMVRVLLEARELGHDMEAAQEPDAQAQGRQPQKTTTSVDKTGLKRLASGKYPRNKTPAVSGNEDRDDDQQLGG